MPISPSLEEAPSERSMPPAANPVSARTSRSIGIVLLESDLATVSYRAKLLTDSRYVVTTARSLSDLFVLRETTGVSLVILSDRFGAVILCSAAQSTRWQWPSARILVLGRAQSVLEDNLYDEAIEHPVVDSDLLLVIQQICDLSSSQRLDRGLFILRRDPIKTTATSFIEESENPLRLLPEEMSSRRASGPCAHLISAAGVECGAFMSTANRLFGEEVARKAGELWVEALETEPTPFRSWNVDWRFVTIAAASKLAWLTGSPPPGDSTFPSPG